VESLQFFLRYPANRQTKAHAIADGQPKHRLSPLMFVSGRDIEIRRK